MESNEIIFKHKSSRDFITLDKQIIYDGMNNQKYIIYKKGSSENNNNVCIDYYIMPDEERFL